MNKYTFKVIFYAIACIILSYLAIFVNQNVMLALYDNLLQSFAVLVTVIFAISLAFFTYTDNIEQKFSDLYKKYSAYKVDKLHEVIGALKKEILLNAGFIFTLFVIEKLIHGLPFEKYKIVYSGFEFETNLIASAGRMSLLLLAIITFIDQIRAFVTSIQYRHIVSKGLGK